METQGNEVASFATPILDLESPYPKPSIPPWLYGSLIALIVALGTVFVQVFADSVPIWVSKTIELLTTASLGSDSSDNLYVFFLLLVPAIAIHESGHALVAIAMGFKVVALKIGPFIIFGRRRLSHQPEASGFVAIELDVIRRIRKRYLWVVAAGPLANVMTGAILDVLAPHFSGILNTLCRQGATVSWLLACLSLIPSSSLALASDGYKIRLLLEGGRRYKQWLASRAIADAIIKGKGADDVRKTWLRRCASADRDTPMSYVAKIVLFAKACESKDVDAAAGHLEHILQGMYRGSERNRDKWALESAVFQAWYKRDLAKASAWHKRIQAPSNINQTDQARFNIAYHSCEGNFSKALECWEIGYKLVDGLSSSRKAKSLQSWTEWRKEIEERALECAQVETASQ